MNINDLEALIGLSCWRVLSIGVLTLAKQTDGPKVVEITISNQWFHFAGRAARLFSFEPLVLSHKENQ